jgi:hypothetical protein
MTSSTLGPNAWTGVLAGFMVTHGTNPTEMRPATALWLLADVCDSDP